MGKILDKFAQTVLELEMGNAVAYERINTEVVTFSKSHRYCLNKGLRKAKIKFGTEKILFQKEAIW